MAASVTLTSTWKAPGETSAGFAGKKVIALVFTTDDSLRMSAEEALAREITARGPQGVAAYRTIPRELLTDKDKAKDWFEHSGNVGVVALRLVGQEEHRVYDAVVWSSGYLRVLLRLLRQQLGAGVADRQGTHRADVDRRDAALSRGGREAAVGGRPPRRPTPRTSGSFMKDLASSVVKALVKEGFSQKGSK